MTPPHAHPLAAASLLELEPWLRRCLLPLESGGRLGVEILGGDDADPPAARTLVSAAVLLGLTQRPSGVQVILTRRSDALLRHSGQVALPGGRAEPGETAVETAMREAEEEIGLHPRFVRPLGRGDRYHTSTGFEITPVVAVVEPGFTLTPALSEVAEVFETPFAFLMDPANHQQRLWRPPEGDPRRYYAITHAERQIWGATAGMFRALWRRAFAAAPDLQPT